MIVSASHSFHSSCVFRIHHYLLRFVVFGVLYECFCDMTRSCELCVDDKILLLSLSLRLPREMITSAMRQVIATCDSSRYQLTATPVHHMESLIKEDNLLRIFISHLFISVEILSLALVALLIILNAIHTHARPQTIIVSRQSCQRHLRAVMFVEEIKI